MEKILQIGHRGASGHRAENTIASFENALELEVDGIELDVHLSLDNEIMVIHDETIDRTTSGTGFVNQFTASELKEYGIPTLTEVFALANLNCFINIELKGSGTAKPVHELIEHSVLDENWNYTHFLVSSFNWEMLQQIRFLNPRIPIGVITDEPIEEALAFAKKIKAHSIHPDYQLLSKENVALMQQCGFQVFPWTVNSKEDIQKIKSFNVNGIISDFPDRI